MESCRCIQLATEGHEAVALLLLQHGADVSARKNYGATPLATAIIGVGSRVEELHPDVVRMVLKEGGWC